MAYRVGYLGNQNAGSSSGTLKVSKKARMPCPSRAWWHRCSQTRNPYRTEALTRSLLELLESMAESVSW